ncbi:MAG: PD-(D/E)XK nuclease domain-containing protein, partial [Verrucomicrobia bacterium]|nr:PD-(D/E)XK nuclease domain-containing protein [Verrucomicrobiota bacterium]
TADGSIDLVLELSKILYIVEIKFNKSAKIALDQIENKKYYQPFLQSKKPIRLLEINFTRKTQKQTRKQSHFTITLESKPFIKKRIMLQV